MPGCNHASTQETEVVVTKQYLKERCGVQEVP
jgi:hypothetical protein